MIPNSPRSGSQFCAQLATLCQKSFLFFFSSKWNEYVYVELTCLLGGSVLSWSVVLVVLL
jgi:hypothetical protein